MLRDTNPMTEGAQRLTQFVRSVGFAEDAAVRSLEPQPRALLGELWRRRAENELRTSGVFQGLHRELGLLAAPPQVLELCHAAIADEAFHAQICQRMAQHYGCRSALPSALPNPPAPRFPVCSPRVHRTLFAALHCSVNETFAVTYLSACLAEANSSVVRGVLKRILQDEVRHSRIGWAVLASPKLGAADRASISGFMPALLDTCVAAWLADAEAQYPAGLPSGHGFLAHRGIAAAARAAIDGVILPGLEHLQLDAAPARHWAAQTLGSSGTSADPGA